jgi:glycerophosphoryl diester phosphodiesterase
VTEAFVSAAHEHGVQVHVWTINDPEEIGALFDLGVDGIVSDHPARVVQVIAQRARS